MVYRKGWYKCQQRELYKVEIGEKEESQPSTEKGFRRPGAMIAKLVDSELKTIAKKTGKSVEKLRADLLVQGGRKLNGR